MASLLACLILGAPLAATPQVRPVDGTPTSYRLEQAYPRDDEMRQNPALLKNATFLSDVLDEADLRVQLSPGSWETEDSLRFIIRRLPDESSMATMRAFGLLGINLLSQGRRRLAIKALSTAKNHALNLDGVEDELLRIEVAIASARLGLGDLPSYPTDAAAFTRSRSLELAPAATLVRGLISLTRGDLNDAVSALGDACANFPISSRWLVALGPSPRGGHFDAEYCWRVLAIALARQSRNVSKSSLKQVTQSLATALVKGGILADQSKLAATGATLILLHEPQPVGGVSIAFSDGVLSARPIKGSVEDVRLLTAQLRHAINKSAFLTSLDPRIFKNEETECRVGKEIFDTLIGEPILRTLGRARTSGRLTLIVERQLLSAPFSSLPLPDASNVYDGPNFECRRLVEEYAIEISPYADYPATLRKPVITPTGSFFSFSDPDYRVVGDGSWWCPDEQGDDSTQNECVDGYDALPQTRAETLAIQKTLKLWTSHIFFGDDATVENFLELGENGSFSGGNILHFAAHGGAPEEVGSGGGIVLAWSKADQDYQVLTPEIIAKFRYDGAWVILSNCNTGAEGTTNAGGLVDAFLKNGARAVLFTQWPINDLVAKDIVSSTVAYWWAEKLDEASSLKKAVNDEIARDRWIDFSITSESPAYTWGAFSIVRNPNF